jgi:hypothetical protein
LRKWVAGALRFSEAPEHSAIEKFGGFRKAERRRHPAGPVAEPR